LTALKKVGLFLVVTFLSGWAMFTAITFATGRAVEPNLGVPLLLLPIALGIYAATRVRKSN
jgi:hypothetical protein